jgi:hypothetical protein
MLRFVLTNDNLIKPNVLIARENPGGDSNLTRLALNKNIMVILVELWSEVHCTYGNFM